MTKHSCMLLAIAAVAMGLATAAFPQDAPPNFIVFVADDMGWNDAGAYGHPSIRTPNIDRLARDGMRFDRAFLTTSSCSPSRCSILTGRYPHATGAGELHLPLPASQVILTEPLRERGYYTAAAGKWHLGDPTRSKFDDVLAGGPSGCEEWIDVLKNRPKGRPFFLWFAANDPHRPYRSTGTIPEAHTLKDVIVPPFLPDIEETRTDLARYYDEVSRLDGYVGEVLAELEAQGVAQNTCVIFMSDNGRPFPRCKTTLYDSGIRTPFIIRYPGVAEPGSTSGSIVSAVDIAPTILELAGAKPLATAQGRSFARLLTKPDHVIRTYAFAERNWHDFAARARSARSDRYLYIRNEYYDLTCTPPRDAVRSMTYQAMVRLHGKGRLRAKYSGTFIAPRPREELYDTQRDPYSLRNLAESSKHATTLIEHRGALDRWKEETADIAPFERRPDYFYRLSGDWLPGIPR